MSTCSQVSQCLIAEQQQTFSLAAFSRFLDQLKLSKLQLRALDP